MIQAYSHTYKSFVCRIWLTLPLLHAAQNSCKVMAKDLVRTRRYISKFYSMKTQLQAVSLRLQTLRSNQQMAEAMKGATKVRWCGVGRELGEGQARGS